MNGILHFLSLYLSLSLSLSFCSLFLLGQEIDVEEVEESDEEDEDGLCAPGEHNWSISRCMVCKFCKFCTGYGPTCCNEGMPGREPGM